MKHWSLASLLQIVDSYSFDHKSCPTCLHSLGICMSIISPTCLHSITQYAVEYGTVRYCDRYSMFAPQPQIYTLLILGSIEFKGQGEGLALAFLFTQAVDRCVFYSMSHCNVH